MMKRSLNRISLFVLAFLYIWQIAINFPIFRLLHIATERKKLNISCFLLAFFAFNKFSLCVAFDKQDSFLLRIVVFWINSLSNHRSDIFIFHNFRCSCWFFPHSGTASLIFLVGIVVVSTTCRSLILMNKRKIQNSDGKHRPELLLLLPLLSFLLPPDNSG